VGRYFKADHLWSFEVDDRFVLGRRPHWQIGVLLAFEVEMNLGSAFSSWQESNTSEKIVEMPLFWARR
jgi:hypothetical protein